MADSDHRCRVCGTTLAQDNTEGICGPCQSARRGQAAVPPPVPPEFWETEDMQAALRSRHMGRVVRAYRHHVHHGHGGLSQELVATWAGTSQGKISRLETGPAPMRLDHLIAWARLLRIPQQHLWFKLPDDPPDHAPSPADLEQAPAQPVAAGTVGPDAGNPSQPETEAGIEPTPGLIVSSVDTEPSDADLTPTLPNPPIHIDIDTAQTARMGDYLLGGGANFAVDRQVTDYITEPLPGGTDTARAAVRAGLDFQTRVVRHLTSERGIRQFLNLTSRIPPRNVIHDVAQQIAPETRVVYAITDDTAMAHAHRLVEDAADNTVAYIRAPGHIGDTDELLRLAAKSLDFTKPIGVLILGILNYIKDNDLAHAAVRHFMNATCSGSYVALTHLTSDYLGAEMAEAIRRLQETIEDSRMVPVKLRSLSEIESLLAGMELIGPGIVPIGRWHPDEVPTVEQQDDERTFMCAVLARKP
jgi:hypothetical protein